MNAHQNFSQLISTKVLFSLLISLVLIVLSLKLLLGAELLICIRDQTLLVMVNKNNTEEEHQ